VQTREEGEEEIKGEEEDEGASQKPDFLRVALCSTLLQ
jgi:hypothetical protein